MKLIDLTILGFGKFHDVNIHFEDGLNVIYGKNEAGKSTLHSFIRGMLFGIEKKPGRASRSDLYTKYEPWDKSSIYEGKLRFSYHGKCYRIERVFQKSAKRLSIINETDGCEIKDPKAFLNEALNGLSETSFTNTVSVGQLKCATENGMVGELKNYIANLNTTGDINLNISSAVDYLKKQRKTFEARLVPEAAKTYSSLIGEIRNIEREISQPAYENQLTHFTALKQETNTRILELRSERETLLQKVAATESALKVAGFRDRKEITLCLEDAEALYASRQELLSLLRQRSRRFLPLFMLLAGFCMLGAAGLSVLAAFPGMFPFLPWIQQNAERLLSVFTSLETLLPPVMLSCTLGAIALILIFCSILAFTANRRLHNQLENQSENLRSLLERHLGSSDFSEEAMVAFRSRIQEMLQLESSLLEYRRQIEILNTELARRNEEELNYAEQLQEQQKNQWELEHKLEHLSNIKNRAEQLNRILAENDEITREIDAINLALETITDLSHSIRSSFGHYLNKEASNLISGITGGIYNSMSIDENLNVFMNTPSKLIPVEQVSSGTMDQIYLALRLASAKLVQGSQEALPLIFDDSFVMYDDERLNTALNWLLKAYPAQILLFTCHRREAQLLSQSGIPFHQIRI